MAGVEEPEEEELDDESPLDLVDEDESAERDDESEEDSEDDAPAAAGTVDLEAARESVR